MEQDRICSVCDKVEKVYEWPCPQTKKEVQQFVGLAGYCQQFIPNFAEITATLTDMIRK